MAKVEPLKIALVGCGQIADAHLQEIRKIEHAEIVGVCDRHAPLARQAAARFGVPAAFADLSQMLEGTRPDVLHVTTPPQTHCKIALAAFDVGAHVYVEKPFSIDPAEADEMLAAAKRAGRQVCVGHDQLFDPIWLECRRICDSGEIGRLVHVESIQGYDLSGPFGQVLSAEPDHWVHRLPGGLFQNTISHALYKITDFLPDDHPAIMAAWRDTHDIGFPTDLSAVIWGKTVTANLTFNSHARPLQRVVRVYGTGQMIEVDFDGQVIRRTRVARLPGAFAKLEVPFKQWRESAKALRKAVRRFARSEIHYFAGMRELFSRFYAAVRGGGQPPVPATEIRRVTALMHRMFDVCRDGESSFRRSVEVGAPGEHRGTDPARVPERSLA
jgi:predicted dehydrogenase